MPLYAYRCEWAIGRFFRPTNQLQIVFRPPCPQDLKVWVGALSLKPLVDIQLFSIPFHKQKQCVGSNGADFCRVGNSCPWFGRGDVPLGKACKCHFFLFSKKWIWEVHRIRRCIRNGTVHEITWPVTHCRSNRYQLLQDLLSKEECEALIDLMKKLPGRRGPAQLS